MGALDYAELKKEQVRLAQKLTLQDNFTKVRLIGGVACVSYKNSLMATVAVFEFPSLLLKEQKKYVLADPLPYHPEFQAYREVSAMVEAYNSLEQEPDLLLVEGEGINHPRKLGLAAHLGLLLNVPTIGISEKLVFGRVELGKIMMEREIRGFEVLTREFANPIYVSPGNAVSLGSALHLVAKTIKLPHKMPEPLHVAHSLARKKMKEIMKASSSHQLINEITVN